MIAFVLFAFPSSASATTLYWIGADGGDPTVASNWTATNPTACSGTAASAAPGDSDIMQFDADCDNGMTLTGNYSVGAIRAGTGYAGTVNMNGYNLTLSSATLSSIWSAGTIQVSTGTLSSACLTFTFSNGTIDATNGNLDFDTALTTTTGNAGTLKLPGAGTATFAANFSIIASSLTLTHNSGTVTFDGSSDQTFSTREKTFNNVSHTGTAQLQLAMYSMPLDGTFTNSGSGAFDANALAVTAAGLVTVSAGEYKASTATQTFNGGLTISGGTFTGSSGTVDVNGALTLSSGTLTAPSGTFTVSGNWAVSGTPTFTAGTNTVTLDGTSGTIDITSAGTSFYKLVLDDGGGTATFEVEDALDVDNDLTITGGTLDVKSDENNSITVGGIWTNSDTFTARSGTVTMNGTSGTLDIVSGGSSFYSLTLNDGGGTATFELEDALDVNNHLTITGGTLDTKASEDNSITVGGNWSNSDTFTTDGGTVTFDASSGTQTLTSGGAGTGQDFQNLTKSGGGTLQLATNSLDVDGTLTISSSTTLDLNALNLTAGTLDNSGTLLLDGSETVTVTTFDSDSGTVKYDGTSSVTIPSGITSYYNLTFDESGTSDPTYTLPDANITVNGVLNLTDGNLTFDDDKNLQISDNGSTGTALTIANGMTLSNTGTGDLTLGGAVSNSGAISFDATGTSDSIQLRSTVNGTKRNWQGSGTFTLTDLDVKDQNATGGTPASITCTSCTNSGNNTNWSFGSVSISGTAYDSIAETTALASKALILVHYNGSTTSSYSATTNASGAFTFSNIDASNGNPMIIYLNDETQEGNLVYISDGATESGLKLYQNQVSLKDGGSSGVTNTNLSNVDDTDDDIKYSVSAGNLSVDSGFGLYVFSGTTFTPGGNVTLTSANIQVVGTMNLNTNTLTTTTSGTIDIDGTLTVTTGSVVGAGAIDNDGTINLDNSSGSINIEGNMDNDGTIDATGVSAAINVFGSWDNTNGTFTPGTTTATMDGTSGTIDIISNGQSFYHLTLNDGGGSATFELEDALDVDGNLTITGGTLDTKSGENNSINVAGDWSNSDAFTERSGTVTFDGSGAQALNGETFYDLTINNSAGSPGDSTDVDSSAAVTVSNTLTVTDGQFQPTTSSSFKNVTISTNGILKPDSSASLTVTGNWTDSGTFTANSSTVTMTATANLAGGTGTSKQFYNLTISTSTATFIVTLTDDLDVSNTLTLSGNSEDDGCGGTNYYYVTLTGATNDKNVTTNNLTINNYATYTSGAATTTVNGTYSRASSGTADWTTDGGTLKMVSNTSQNLPADTYKHLELDDNGGGATTYTLSAATTAQGNLTIQAGATLDTKSGSNYSLTIGGSWSNSGTFTARSGTVTFNGSGGSDTIDPGSSSFYGLTFNNSSGVWDLTSNGATVTNALTITLGIFDLNGQSLTATGAAVSIAGTLRLQGGETVTGLTMDTDSGTVIYDGTSTYSSGLAAGDSYYHLTFNGSGGSWTLDANLDVNGTLTITAGTLDVNATSNYSINVATDWSNSGTFNERSGTVTFDGSGAQTLNGETFYNLTINNSAGSPGDSTDVDSSAAVTVSGTLTVSDGQFQPTTGSSFTDVSVTTNGILKPDESASVSVSGNWSNTGTFTPNSGTVTFNGSAAQTLTGETFYDLTINNTYGSPDDTYDVDSSAAVTVSNTLTVTDGQFQPATSSSFKDISIGASGVLKPDSGADITVSDNWTNAGTFTPNSGTVTFSGTSSGTLITGGTGTGYDFYNLTVNKTSSTDASDNLALSTNSLVINGTLTVTDGEFLQSGDVDITVATTSVAAAGKWNITGGTASDKVVVTIGSGGVTNAGTISFNGLSGSTGGGDADVIQIRSSTSGTKRTWTSSGSPTFTMVDVDVKDQTTSPATLEIDVLSGTDSGNNTRWFFDDKIEHFVITTTQPTTLSIGSSILVTITAKNNLGNTITSGYSGDKTLTFSGASVTSGGQYAAASDKNNTDVNFGTAATVTFTCGGSGCAAASTLKFYSAESISVDVSDGTYDTTGSDDYDLDLTITPAAAVALKFTTEPAPSEIIASVKFTTQPAVAVVDSYGNTVTDDSVSKITLAAVLASDGTTVAPGTLLADENPVTVSSGVATFSGVSYNQSGTIKLKATSGSLTAVLSTEIKVTSTKGAVYLTDVNGLEKLGYSIGEAVYVKVTDDDENTDFATKQTVEVTVTNQNSGDSEKITLEETGNDTAIFTNKNGTTPPHAPLPSSVRAAGIPDNFMLEVPASGAVIVAQYTDNDDASDMASDSASFAGVSFSVVANVTGAVEAGTPFDLVITAVSGAGGSGTPLVGYTGSAVLSVNYVSPSSGTKAITPSSVSAFSAGTATVSVQYPDAGKIKITATDTIDSAMTGESQELVMIPASLDVSIPVAPLTIGKDFTMTVTARNVSGEVTPNYQGPVNLEAQLESGGQGGTLLVSSGASFTNGIWTLTNRYGLWGKIFISATDAVYSDVTGESEPVDFIPDKLEVKLSPPPEGRAAASLYTYYSGETFGVTIRALDASGQQVSNYGGAVQIKATSSLVMPANYQFSASDQGEYRFDVLTAGDQAPFTVEAQDSAWPQVTGVSSPSAEVLTATIQVESTYGLTGQPVEVKVRLVDSRGQTITQDSATIVRLIFYVEGKKLSEDSLLPTLTLPEAKALAFTNGVASFTVSSAEIRTITVFAQPGSGSAVQESMPGTIHIGSIGGRNVRILSWNEVRSPESQAGVSTRKGIVLQ